MHPVTPPHVFAERRARVLARLGERAALLLGAAPELHAGDTELRYLVAAELYYLTGYVEPEAVLLLAPALDAPFTLFVRPRDAERELWTGIRGGVDAARERFGADAAHPVGELRERLPRALEGVDHLYYRLRPGSELDRLVGEALTRGRARRPRHGTGLHTLSDPGLLLDELRVVKDAHELAAMRAAARITVESFAEARAALRPGMGEWELEALIESGFRRRGAAGPAFPSIVASGASATVLHYVDNARTMVSGDAVLIDAGARAAQYCADVSRTWPVDGRFSPAQQEIHGIVRAAHAAALASARPGGTVAAVHDAAVRALVDGLVAVGLLQGDAGELTATPEGYRRYYPHRTSHWLGLETHDAGDYLEGGTARALVPGMVLTVEPGLYIPAHDERAPGALRGLGVRLEDDVLITADGHEVLTAGLPL